MEVVLYHVALARRREAGESLRLFGAVVNAQAEVPVDTRRRWLDATSEAAGSPPPTLMSVNMMGEDVSPEERARRDEVNREAKRKLLERKGRRMARRRRRRR